MRVIVAGASGAIGRVLLPQLLAAKHEVFGITRRTGSLSGAGVREIVADVMDRPGLLAALIGVKADAVVHQLTALKKAPRSMADMRETNRLRSEGTSSLIAAARATGAKKFVAASIFYGYGFGVLGPTPLDETARFGSRDRENDAVIRALVSLEEQVRAAGGVSLRYGLFYGGSEGVAPVSRTASGVLPMVHLEDAASAVAVALMKSKAGEVYNIADEHPVTWREREQAIATAAGARAPMKLPDAVLRLAAPFGSQLMTRTSVPLTSQKARTELGWKPKFESIGDWAAASHA
jgi:nucleoside-diphosphate-sugar epimerase